MVVVAVASPVLSLVAKNASQRYSVHSQSQSQRAFDLPEKTDSPLFADVKSAQEVGAVAVGATIYFGNEPLTHQIERASLDYLLKHTGWV